MGQLVDHGAVLGEEECAVGVFCTGAARDGLGDVGGEDGKQLLGGLELAVGDVTSAGCSVDLCLMEGWLGLVLVQRNWVRLRIAADLEEICLLLPTRQSDIDLSSIGPEARVGDGHPLDRGTLG